MAYTDLKLGFFFRLNSYLSLEARRRLVAVTFLLDYYDIIYIQALFTGFGLCLSQSIKVYCKFKSPYPSFFFCTLGLNGPHYHHRLKHWHIFIYKIIWGLLLSYLTVHHIMLLHLIGTSDEINYA